MPSFTDLILVSLVLFIIFGARSFPELGAAIGRSIARRRQRLEDERQSRRDDASTPSPKHD